LPFSPKSEACQSRTQSGLGYSSALGLERLSFAMDRRYSILRTNSYDFSARKEDVWRGYKLTRG